MATLAELQGLISDATLRNRVVSATIIAANAELIDDPGTAEGRNWGLQVLQDPARWGDIIIKAIIAANADASVAAIMAATDNAIKNQVDAVVPGVIAAVGGA